MAMPALVVGLWVEFPSARELAGVGGMVLCDTTVGPQQRIVHEVEWFENN